MIQVKSKDILFFLVYFIMFLPWGNKLFNLYLQKNWETHNHVHTEIQFQHEFNEGGDRE
jgi:membrane-anchored glycerophosphoryl diester phosphodiesterase (GDPDase)